MGYSYFAPSATTAHTHSNAAGDGGALSIPNTLMGNGSLFALMVST